MTFASLLCPRREWNTVEGKKEIPHLQWQGFELEACNILYAFLISMRGQYVSFVLLTMVDCINYGFPYYVILSLLFICSLLAPYILHVTLSERETFMTYVFFDPSDTHNNFLYYYVFLVYHSSYNPRSTCFELL
jgi:hypothetical protein